MARPLRFSAKQRKVLSWWYRDEWEAIICDGAVRSGKTFSMGLSFFLWAQSRFDGQQFGLCGKTIGSLQRNLLAELIPYLRTMDPERAAAESGCRNGFSMLRRRTVRERLERMREAAAGQLRREDVLRRLAELAFGRANDGAGLALRPGETDPEGLDLSAVSVSYTHLTLPTTYTV